MITGAQRFKKAVSVFEKKTGRNIQKINFEDLLGYVDTPEGWYNEIKTSQNTKFNGQWKFVIDGSTDRILGILGCEVLLSSCNDN